MVFCSCGRGSSDPFNAPPPTPGPHPTSRLRGNSPKPNGSPTHTRTHLRRPRSMICSPAYEDEGFSHPRQWSTSQTALESSPRSPTYLSQIGWDPLQARAPSALLSERLAALPPNPQVPLWLRVPAWPRISVWPLSVLRPAVARSAPPPAAEAEPHTS